MSYTTAEKKTHYVAQLKIERVDKVENRDRQSASGDKRDISEVTQLTIKADSLESLVEKLGKHVAIIEED